MNALKRIDFLFLIYLVLSTVFLVFAWDPAVHSPVFIWIRALMLLFVFALITLNNKLSNPVTELFRYSYPLLICGYFYSETVYYNKLFFSNLDPFLVDIESAFFKIQPSLEFSSHLSNKLFSELMYFAYFSFYLLILIFTLYVFLKRRENFIQLTFRLSASLYIFYLIFCFFPSEGPQFYFSFPENKLPDAFLFNHIMHFIQQMAEKPTGAFPSSHVGVSVIILMLSKKYAPRFFKITWPLVVLLILSTVYIKAHYVVDVVGGIIIAPLVLFLSDFLFHLRWGIVKKLTLTDQTNDKT